MKWFGKSNEQKARKPRDTCILLTGIDGFCRNGKFFAVILACQLHVSIQSLLRATIPRKRWLYCAQQRRDILRGQQLLANEMSQVVLLVIDVQAEIEMLRIDASDVKVGDVAHRADTECNIES